jgi:hypothetical protein
MTIPHHRQRIVADMLSYMRLLLCALVCLSVIVPKAQIAQAQTTSATRGEQIYRIGEDGASAPIVLQKNDPKYPEEACREAREGTVGLSLIVSSSGRAQLGKSNPSARPRPR